MSLKVAFDPAGLDPHIVDAFDDLIASLQTWAGQLHQTQTGALSVVQPRCRYILSADQTITNNTDTAIQWPLIGKAYSDEVLSTVAYDNGTTYGKLFIQVASATYLTPPLAGNYLVVAGATFAANATGRRDLWLQQRTTSGAYFDIAGVREHTNVAGTATQLQVSAIVPMGEFVTGYEPGVRVMVFQNSGGDLALTSGFSGTYVSMLKVS